jgi:hypothetical protein
MGVLLGQLPPAELARLKAELAETLIAHFCYPRFFDYRTNSLRSRPVDRSKRQEVWLYLSSFDFTAWNRVDLMSPDFQHYVERLFIHFVQRNRSFFGEQGRKRMADVRMLIGASAQSVVQGLRGHLMGQHQQNHPFGSPRPVTSWSATNITGRSEPTWNQISSSIMVLQQQLQEARGEMKPAPQQSEARSATTPARRSDRPPAASVTIGRSANGAEHRASSVSNIPTGPMSKTTPPVNGHGASPFQGQRGTAPLNPAHNTAAPASTPRSESAALPVEPSILPIASATVPVKSPGATIQTAPPASPAPSAPVQETAPPHAPSNSVQARGLPPAMPTSLSATQRESAAVLASEEDMAIFEQLRHQLIVWLRIEAVRSGLEIANQSPSQLLELLRQQNSFDETRLQVVSTLLNLCNQVIKNGQASLFDYKQALMFHLMHTKR